MLSAKTFFQRAVKIFLWTLWARSRYLEGPPRLVLCVSKKIVAARHTNQIIFKEMWKKLGFWKNEAQMSLEYSNNTSCFEVKLFFQRAVKIFCGLYWHAQGIWKVLLTLFFTSVKKSDSYDTSIKIYREEKLMVGYFTPPLCKLILKKSTLRPYVLWKRPLHDSLPLFLRI